MTVEQAEEIIMLVRASTSSKPDEIVLDYYRASLAALDYDVALAAATTGTVTWRRFPSWADFKEMYNAQRRLREPVGEQRSEASPDPIPAIPRGKREIPMWVRRWVAARMLYERFGKAKDVRPFREQESVLGPAEEWMPEDEWVEEAARISDKDVWKAVGG